MPSWLRMGQQEAIEPVVDGRHRRAERSHRDIIAAALALVRETGEPPSPEAMAERAGVSRRTIFRLFDDLDALHAKLIAFQRAEVLERFPPPVDVAAPLPERVRALVLHRAAMFEYILPLRIVAERRAHQLPVVAEALRQARQNMRAHLELMLGDVFADLPAARRRDRFDEAELLLSVGAWRHLRQEQGRSRAAATRVLLGAIRRLVGVAEDE